jgi:diguanylate cyclase (GGDEF)-like protein/PAS domain S-box-containing protein
LPGSALRLLPDPSRVSADCEIPWADGMVSSTHIKKIRFVAWLTAVAWTVLIGVSFALFCTQQYRSIVDIAKAEARISLEKDTLFRMWGARHGGVYVPATSDTPPNPYLSKLRERDISTPSGVHLTLINPAYMVRQMFESVDNRSYLFRGHLTSLNPIRKENAPDQWESKALKAFEGGAREISELQQMDGHTYMRVMRPFLTTTECLKCHAAQGYKLGNVRGGISVSVPLETFFDSGKSLLVVSSLAHGTIWLLGLGLIGVGSRKLILSSKDLGEQAEVLAEEVNERRKAEGQISQHERFLSTIIESEPECVKMLDKDGKIQMMNRSGLAMIDAESLEQVQGRCVYDLVAPLYQEKFRTATDQVFAGNPVTLEFEIVSLKGQRRWLETHAVPLRDDKEEILALLGITRDITERKNYEEQLFRQANYDPLTGLPNRNLLSDRFRQAAAGVARARGCLGLMLMDLDNFKIVNDTFGHAVGDQLLKDVATRLGAAVRTSDCVSRLGGDEFVVVPADIESFQDMALIAHQILAAFGKPFTISGREIFISMSIGIVTYPQDGDTIDTLIQHADIAMYHAKHTGKDNFQFFTEEMNVRVRERMEMEEQLHRALEQDEFRIAYQPLCEVSTGRIVSVEALLRWQQESGEEILPEKFIPPLEDTGLIVQAGDWVLVNACRQLAAWQGAGHGIRLAVNVSARQLKVNDIVERITGLVKGCGVQPNSICLELTESVIMQDIDENIKKLLQLREAGFGLAIDDFGIGFSSLNYLKRLPLTKLKIDRSFIAGIPVETSATAIVRTIVNMAASMEMVVVAEGVETQEQFAFLKEISCDFVQGYFFCPPIPPDAMGSLLQRGYLLPGNG